MNFINKEYTKELKQEFSRCLYKYGKPRVDFCCTTKGFYVWFYTDDKLIDNLKGYETCKGTQRDSHKRERSTDELILLEKTSHERYSYYLVDMSQADKIVDVLRECLLEIKKWNNTNTYRFLI